MCSPFFSWENGSLCWSQSHALGWTCPGWPGWAGAELDQVAVSSFCEKRQDWVGPGARLPLLLLSLLQVSGTGFPSVLLFFSKASPLVLDATCHGARGLWRVLWEQCSAHEGGRVLGGWVRVPALLPGTHSGGPSSASLGLDPRQRSESGLGQKPGTHLRVLQTRLSFMPLSILLAKQYVIWVTYCKELEKKAIMHFKIIPFKCLTQTHRPHDSPGLVRLSCTGT